MAFAHLGPYTIAQLRQIADRFDANILVGPPKADILAQCLQRPCIVLWLETSSFGHYILLHPRHVAGKTEIEIFDPLGTSKSELWDSFMDDTKELNGGGLRGFLQTLYLDGVPISYNSMGPQALVEQSCGLWCLLRALAPGPSPSKFSRLVDKLSL